LPGTLSNATQAATDVKPFVLSPEQQQLIEKSLAEIKAAQNPLPGTLSNATQAATDVKPFVLSPEQQQQLNEYSNTMKKQLGISQ
jgi:ABC-type thiamine transport system substrate-binding protein